MIIKLSELSFNEQIKIFNEAKIIIGSHGAGLTNLIFCEPSTKVIEIGNPNFDCDVFKNISKNKILDGSEITHLYADKITIPSHPYWELNKHQFETVAKVDIAERFASWFMLSTSFEVQISG